jgi:hypothetical protein
MNSLFVAQLLGTHQMPTPTLGQGRIHTCGDDEIPATEVRHNEILSIVRAGCHNKHSIQSHLPFHLSLQHLTKDLEDLATQGLILIDTSGPKGTATHYLPAPLS